MAFVLNEKDAVIILTRVTTRYIIKNMKHYNVVIIGAGASGLSAAATATSRGRSVAVLDMGQTPARKVAISGGGRCNFTNIAVGRDRYFGNNPDFVRSALSRISPHDILDWAKNHSIEYTEKSPGQFFTTKSALDIVNALINDAADAEIILNGMVKDVSFEYDKFIIKCNNKQMSSDSLIIATGGLSFSTLGVSDTGYKIAKAFGHKIIPPRPALCAIDTDIFPSEFAGISIPAQITVGDRKLFGDMLFTHFGIGGPIVYSASVADRNTDITINLMPGINLYEWLKEEKNTNGRKTLRSVLSMRMPARIAKFFCPDDRNIADIRDNDLNMIAKKITDIKILAGTWNHHGMAAAEVTYGGIDTKDISSKTMESKLIHGLFFAGEVMDITGDLGGFNLHWAWASGRIAGMNA